jgi:ectoine hydroxylase-related dioxygenase (phytanoyl-CoA dioxygenase family)
MNRRPKHAIDAKDIADYRRDGAVCLRDQFDEDWLALLREQTECAMTTPGPNAEEYTQLGKPGRYFGDLDLSQRWPGFRNFVLESPAAEIAGRIMASGKINFFYDQLLVKEPGTQERTPWHQDQPYWAVVGRDVCSIWLPLDPVSKSASLSYVIGSHAWGSAFNPQHFKDGSAYQGKGLPPLPDIDADPERYALLGWNMEPGRDEDALR